MPRRAVNVGIAAAVVVLAAIVIGLLLGGSGQRDRASELQQRLRCPVCKSVSIDESQSQTAVAMRRAVAEQLAAGRSDADIIDFFRARYGEWVLLDPPVQGATALLWLLPAAATLLGLAVLLARAHSAVPAAGEISATDRERVATELARTRRPEEDL